MSQVLYSRKKIKSTKAVNVGILPLSSYTTVEITAFH